MDKDDYLKISLVVALIAIGITSACVPAWTGASAIITGIFALLNFHPKN
jgi:ribosomal protein L31